MVCVGARLMAWAAQAGSIAALTLKIQKNVARRLMQTDMETTLCVINAKHENIGGRPLMISWYWLIPAAWVGAMAMLLMMAVVKRV